MHPIRALHIVPGLELSQGGPAYTVPKLCEALVAAKVDTQIWSVARQVQKKSVARDTMPRIYLHRWDQPSVPFLGGLRKSSALSHEMAGMGGKFDICHVHGLWTWPSIVASRKSQKNGIPFVLSPRGMLSPGALRISSVKKRLFWHLFQKSAICGLACFHATGALEVDELRDFCRVNDLNVPIAMIPNGVEVMDPLPRMQLSGTFTVLALGRIHPKKGLDVLIRAWARIACSRPNWRLRIVGPDERGHARELERLVVALNAPRVSIEGPCYGLAKSRVYRDSDIYVLPSRSENFGVTIAEALASELPVITTRNTPWATLVDHDCGWWIDEGEGPLSSTLLTATALSPDDREKMGRNGRRYVCQAFKWENIGFDMSDVYAWLLGRRSMPSVVSLM